MRHYPVNVNASKQKEKTMTVGELIEELSKLPKQAEVRYSDVCGNMEAELYEVEINADEGIVILVGDEI